jgi:hypothetical protein
VGHVKPHRWADAAAGRVSDSQLESFDAHASTCTDCATTRERVFGAREVFAEMNEADPPDLHWDHIGARIYWVTSSEQRAAERSTKRPAIRWQLAAAGLGAVAVAAAALLYVTGAFDGSASDEREIAADTVDTDESPREVTPITPVAPEVEAEQLIGVVTYAAGEVTVDGATLDFDGGLTEGTTIATGEGRVAIQFGDGSGFAIAPGSQLTVRQFDERSVVLDIDGTVSVDLSPRAEGQTFSVVAGEHTVAVRGTAFEVDHRDGAVGVICSHGRVMVTDGAAELDVSAGYALRIAAGAELGTLQPNEVELDEALARQLAVPMVPVWAGPEDLLTATSSLEVDAPVGRSVRIDGIGAGNGQFRMRVTAGRHLVETESTPGKWGEGEWLELAAGERETATWTPEPKVEPKRDSAKDRRTRLAQLRKKVRGNSRIDGCLRSIRKQGLLEGSFVVLDVGINTDGSLAHLNIASTNLPSSATQCVRNVVDQVRLPAGPRATVREKLAW